jgi:hypothetical protein
LAPIPLFAAASKLWKSLTGDGKERAKLESALSGVFGAQENLHIRADDFSEPLGEASSGESAALKRGGEGDTQWLEWSFPAAGSLKDATLEQARWRFHRSGLVVFNGTMRTERGGLDRGDLLGHRIEVSTREGLQLGAWMAGFFVRPGAAVDRYVATTKVDATVLALYFDDVDEAQLGQWFRRR